MNRYATPAVELGEAEYDRRVASLVKDVIDIEIRMTELGFGDAVPHLQMLRSHIAACSVMAMEGFGRRPDRDRREFA